MSLLMLLTLLGCPSSDDGNTTPTDETQATDSDTTGDTQATGDTEVEDTAVTWMTLDGDCEAPDSLPDDPITQSGQVRLTPDHENFFVEFVDLHQLGDRMYGVGQGGLVILDVSSGEPELIGKYADSNRQRFHRVEPIDDDTVAVTHRDNGLYLIDTSDLSDLTLIAQESFDLAGVEGLAYSDPYLYVTTRTDGLLVYDVSEPEDLQQLGSMEGLEQTWDLTEIADGWTYAADNDLGVVPIDLSDPTSPEMGTPVDLGGAVIHVERHGDLLLASVGSEGMVILSIEDPANPVVLGAGDTGGSVVMAAGDGDLAVAVDHEAVAAFDISDPSNPVLLGREDTEQFALAVELDGAQAWVGDWNLFTGFTVDTTAVSGDLDASSDALLFETEGEVDVVTLSNRGSGELSLVALSSTDERITLEVSDTVVAPGDSAKLRLTWAPDEAAPSLDATLCVVSDDPDEPTYAITVGLGDDTGPVGREAPDFTLEDLDGELYNVREQLGTPIMLAYFATW